MCIRHWFRMSYTSTHQSKTDFCRFTLFNHVFKVKTRCLFCTVIECDCATSTMASLLELLLKIVTFNTVLMVLKIVTLLYNGHLCFFHRDRYTTRDGYRERKKNPEVKAQGHRSGGSGEENTIFVTLKMQFQGLLTHGMLGLSTNATPKLLSKL